MSCSNEEIIAYLDALIKYKSPKNIFNLFSTKTKPILNPNCDIDSLEPSQKFKHDNGIAQSIPINELPVEDLATLKEQFFTNKPSQDEYSILSVNLEYSKIIEKINEAKKKLDDLTSKHNITDLDEIKKINLQIKKLEEDLKQVQQPIREYHNNGLDEKVRGVRGGKRKSKRRKSKNPTKKGKKNRKSNKKYMKKSMKK